MTSSDMRQSALALLDAADVLHVLAEEAGPMRARVTVQERSVRGVATQLLEDAREAERGESHA